MMQQVNAPPLAFERKVRDVSAALLVRYGFQCAETFPLYANEQVEFVRYRQGQRERISFGRRSYGEEHMADPNKEDEVDGFRESGQGKFWPSRHLFHVGYYVNYAGADLFPNGKIGYSLSGAEWWNFTDEADLARRLRDEALPMILGAGLKWFDEELDNQLDLIEWGISTPYRPPDAA
jgi:hypothetical protein